MLSKQTLTVLQRQLTRVKVSLVVKPTSLLSRQAYQVGIMVDIEPVVVDTVSQATINAKISLRQQELQVDSVWQYKTVPFHLLCQQVHVSLAPPPSLIRY
jgi:hypothetical protein